ncbi:MFS transporter [Microbacterium imperiale]|uniref:MFS transporter n=1 Tax=Microbacterium imperiale TaxID=33884 RepID=A0A9W6HJT3_9MICO|nr:MFS transporter [Microbacterium imperiale]MBP2421852.1 MFS family permease [Microbacterium imperiale]MDS0199047.1 MFS transporter [Microbacterium imperiale]BFE39157.1 MFS transporter [Microbacterium imperiale]GLJ81147.1 MFS transporter [Microbacterium imperiale]
MTTNDRSLIHHTGWGFFPIAFVARLPFAMMVVGVLTLVVSATGSVGLGGLTSAAVGIGVVIAGPVIGDAVDRFGQRRVLVPLGIANGILLGLFPVVVTSGLADPVILAAAAAIGLSAPQAAAMSRSRLMGIIRVRVGADHRPRTLSRVMSYESAADETAFVIGPFLVGILAAVIAPWAPIAIAAALSLVFVTAFALHPSGRVAAALPAGEVDERAPMAEVLRGRILVLVAATFGVGLFFGATLTSLTAFAQTAGEGVEAGLLYGLMGIGSAALALAVVLLPTRFALRHRWLVFAAVLALSAGGYAAADSLGLVVVMLLLMGLGVGPTLVTLFSIAGHRSPVGRSATTMTLLGSALTLAQALASAVTGAIAEAGEVRLAMLLPTIAGVLVLGLGLVNLGIERRERSAPAVDAAVAPAPAEALADR